MRSSHSAFTLVELLVVIAIIATLAVVVILVINPVELLRQSRDSNRISDLATLNTALAAYNTDQPSGNMGSATKVYVSIPDATSTCANLGLPTLPSGWSYNCATSANLRKANGTGWVPVNLTSISFGTPLATLPIDPQNTTTTMYYTYVPGGSWQLTSRLESQRYQPKAALTNDYDPGLYIQGSDTDLAPFVGGLVGWWKFDEGSGTSATDSSGWGNTGTWYGSGTHYMAGKIGAYSGSFNGINDSVLITTINLGHGSWTVSAWVKTSSDGSVLSNSSGGPVGNLMAVWTGKIHYRNYDGSWEFSYGTSNVGNGSWHFLTWVNLSNQTMNMYVDGTLENGGFNSLLTSLGPVNQIGLGWDGTAPFNGLIDDVRIYTRALSAAEISAIYNATK